MDSFADEQLVREYLQKGDEKALERLIARYLPLIYGYIRNYTGSSEHAADIAQEVFVKAWKHLKRFDQAQSFRTWIFTIAKRTAIDWMKKKQALPFSAMSSEGDDFAQTIGDTTPSIVDQLSLRQSSQQLALALAQLPQGYRSIIDLHINKDLTFREIAVSLEKPLNTVKSQYRRGLALMKKVMMHQKD